ncbi:DUF2971 domain-containing protein (plasmid) [Komagataeibacter nataicola]|uniref:DUF2971 domain-containing protein n=1 Tax=Komagataeibacter nataicola TaxID=265960 RepID=UPI0023DD447F|nr:DUF2971 domain-containing protein [Komagataeibacter nataicola]WEQ54361.1 DUF2971 domain-containing protein [Komagataeibacter nataicola]
MEMNLFRIRSCSALLNEFKELENQEIYFAHPKELNDPMEGLSDIFWEGDDVVWENLFKHYIRVFDRAISLYLIGGEQYPIELEKLPFVHFDDLSMSEKHKSIHQELFDNFFSEPAIVSYIYQLTSKKICLRRSQFLMHLRILHPFIISIFFRCYERNDLLPKGTYKDQNHADFVARVNNLHTTIDLMPKVPISEELNRDAAIETLFTFQNMTLSQIDLIHYFNKSIRFGEQNRIAVFVDFPDVYVNQIENLVRPQWYAACFMEECKNSSLWGHYGANHTGICLKFRTQQHGGKPALNLKRTVGYNGGGSVVSWFPCEFEKVSYTDELIPLDFFDLLPGRLPIPTLNRLWYFDGHGNKSARASSFFDNEHKWRSNYYDIRKRVFARKSSDWKFENEHRLVLQSDLINFSDVSSRKLRYDFNSLDGIIFGIKTPISEKISVAKIIETKCLEHKRKDFKFYQAYYSPQTRSIEQYEMKLLKFDIS